MDTGISYNDATWAFISSDEDCWARRLHQLAAEHPDSVTVIKEPEANGGYIYARIPRKWLIVRPPIERHYTPDQRAKMVERLRRNVGTGRSKKDDTQAHVFGPARQ